MTPKLYNLTVSSVSILLEKGPHMVGRAVHAATVWFAIASIPSIAWTQQMSNQERERALEILQVVSGELKKHYYDPTFHGVDWDARFAEAKRQIEQEQSFNMSMSHIAAALGSLNDSHTFLIPPKHAYQHDYDFRYQMIGDRCFVTEVRPKSDADMKRIKPGDEILSINGFTVTRDNLWKMQYVYSVLRPQPGLSLRLQDPSGAQREVDVIAHMRQEKRVMNLNEGIFDATRNEALEDYLMRDRYQEYGDQLIVLKLPKFSFSQKEVEHMMGRADQYQSLIIDLRGNPGGSVESLKYLVGGMFDKGIKIADRVGRNGSKPEKAKDLRNRFTGKVVVLVDARTASAAEVFARVIQLEKRGVVVGDRTSGSVMEAKQYEEKIGKDTIILYGASITESDLIMTDGKSLEHAGVSPDEIVLPSSTDLAAGRDPVLARAAAFLGVSITPEESGKAFPFEWPPQQ